MRWLCTIAHKRTSLYICARRIELCSNELFHGTMSEQLIELVMISTIHEFSSDK